MHLRHRLVRRIALLLAALFVCTLVSFHSADANRENRWRRTAQGWVSNLEWESMQAKWDPPPVTGVHPVMVTSLQLLLSVGGLLAFDRAVERMVRPSDNDAQ